MKVDRTIRRVAALVVAVMATASLASCGSSNDHASGGSGKTDASGSLVVNGETIADAALWKKAQSEGSMTIYTAYTADKEQKIVDAFTKATGLKVNVVALGTAPLVTRLQSESKAHKYTADVVKLGNLVNINALATGGLLSSYQPPAAFNIPAVDKGGNGEYWAWNQSPLAPGYNTAVVNDSDAPKSWADLLNPRWKGKLGLAPFSAGGVEIATFQFLRNDVDPNYWTKLAAQQPQILSVMASVAQALTNGQIQVGIVQPSVLGQAMSQGAKIKFVPDPPEGLPLSNNFVGIAAHAPHAAVAQVYLNYLFSKAGQTVLSQQIGDYSVRTDVPPPVIAGVKMPALNSGYKFYPLNNADTIKSGAQWTTEWNTAFHYKG